MSRTAGEMMDTLLKCESEDDIKNWMNKELEFQRSGDLGLTDEELIELIKSNVGYMAGYYSEDTRRKVLNMIGAVHPVFGNRGI